MNAKPATTPNASATQPALSKIDLAAMKTADSVCFRKCKGEAGSTIECNKEFERTEKNPFARTETITLRVSDRFHSYADDMHSRNYDIRQNNAWAAFDMIHSPHFSEEWQTICQCLKAGDVLSVEWIADGGNGYTKDAGLHVDELRLIAIRGEKRLTFSIRQGICQNNSARMIHA